MKTVAVVGAGISGLSAAYYLSKASHVKVRQASDCRFDMGLPRATINSC